MSVSVRRTEGFAVVTLASGKVNLLDLELLQALNDTLAGVADARGIVLTGNGRCFSAGVDLQRILDEGAAYTAALVRALSDTLLNLFTQPRPVVAAIDGHAIAGGALLALACDYRVMAAGRLGVPELAVGVPLPTVALEILRHTAGSAFRPTVLRSSSMSVEEAVAVGLIDESVSPDELMETAMARVMSLASIPARTFELTKRQIHAPALERIARDSPLVDAEVVETWCSGVVVQAIRSYVNALATRAR